MKKLCPGGLLLALVSVAAAQDVQWTLTGPAEVTQGGTVTWQAAVSVAGPNQGLAGYAFSIVVGPAPGPPPGPDATWGTADDENVSAVVLSPAAWVPSFQVAGGPGPASVKDVAAQGGPGLAVLASAGSPQIIAGELIQVGAGCLSWNPAESVAGVGLEARKSVLLADPGGAYVLHSGEIPTSGLAPGQYTVVLIPLRARVLRDDLDFALAQPGFIMKEAASAGSSFNVLVSALFIPGDFDHNGYVDAADLDIFLACGTGPAGAYAASGCSLSPDGEGYVAADLDRDHDVDQVDFGVFQRCYSGALPGNPGCAD